MSGASESGSETEQTPQETPFPRVKGVCTFSCCGNLHAVSLEGRGTLVCPRCFAAYDLMLFARAATSARYPKGARLRVTRAVQASAGAKSYNFAEGEAVVAGEDRYGVLVRNPGFVAVEVEVPDDGGNPRVLLALLPEDALTVEGE